MRRAGADRPAGGRLRARLGLLVLVLASGLTGCELQEQTSVLPITSPPAQGLWLSAAEIAALPTSGPAWTSLEAYARAPLGQPDLSDQDDPASARILARALVAVRTGDRTMAKSVAAGLRAVRGTEQNGTALSVGRELLAYVLAADLVGLSGEDRAGFERWLRRMQTRSHKGRTLRETHEQRPNNWGTHAGATRIAVAAYLGDREEVLRAAHVFSGWLGEEAGWQHFDFGSPAWQPKGARRFGVNPVGARREGHSIDGVLPDDQRRGGAFVWPPPRENYVWEALQGAVAQAWLLERLGFDAFEWGDRALLRAVTWLHTEADYPAVGDDTWIPHLVNSVYGTRFPVTTPSRPGKAVGFTDWTHAAAPSPSALPTPAVPRSN